MLRKSITYDFYDEDMQKQSVTENFYFNLSKPELIKIEAEYEGGFSNHLEEVVGSNDPARIMATFSMLVLMSYGIRSDDGKRFIKSDELSKEFSETDAYNKLFMELMVNPPSVEEFINAIIPDGLGKVEIPKKEAEVEVVNLNEKDAMSMTREELVAAFKAKNEARKQ